MDNKTFLEEYGKLYRERMHEAEKAIAEHFGMTIVELRKKKSEAYKEKLEEKKKKIVALRDGGYSVKEIADFMKMPEHGVRSFLEE